MTLIEAKEILAKAHMCDMIPCGAKYCEHCQLKVTVAQEKEGFDYLYSLLKDLKEVNTT